MNLIISPENGYMIAERLDLDRPRNQKAAVLKMLIENNGVSEQQTPWNGFRTRLSELRREHHLNIRIARIRFKSQFGREGYYNKHFLYDKDKAKAVKLYKVINK